MVLVLVAVATMCVPAMSWGRGFGGGGRVGGGFGGARVGGGLGGGALAGRGATLEGRGGGGLGTGELGGGRLSGADFAGAGSRLSGLEGAGSRLDDLNLGGRGGDLGGGGLAGELGGGGLAGDLAARQAAGGGAAPSRAQLSSFLGLPSDNGLHGLSGETQSRLNQLHDDVRAGDGPLDNRISGETQSKGSQLFDEIKQGDGPLQNRISGETQSKGSQIYDQIKDGDGPLSNRISGETQSKGSQIYDAIRAGDGPVKNFIPGETQKPLSRLYDKIRAGDHPFQPWSPWIAHNNAVVIRNNFNNYYVFTPGWYRRYPGAWYPAAWAYGSPWVYAPWPTLSVWLGYPSSQPTYYDYGNNVVSQDNSIYVDGQNMGTADEYYQQAETLAQSGADANVSDDGQWMSLGVFAISESGQTSADDILQLAVNKQGIIRGNMTNTKLNENKSVRGAVDKQTELAAWIRGDDTNTVFETGIYNLTKDQTPAIIHYGDGRTEQVLMVRLDQSQQDQDAPQASP